jgi:hypothetical protein
MPRPSDPNKREFYVYRFAVGNTPVYVGIGRDKRASDRVRYVKYMMERSRLGKPVKWSLSTRVIAQLIHAGYPPRTVYVIRKLTRSAAIARERLEITRLVRRGALLANVQHNPNRDLSPSVIVKVIVNCQRGL